MHQLYTSNLFLCLKKWIMCVFLGLTCKIHFLCEKYTFWSCKIHFCDLRGWQVCRGIFTIFEGKFLRMTAEGIGLTDTLYWRGVKEAINIKRTNSDLNRDRGGHHLPNSYNRLISSSDSGPSGLCHVTSPSSQ